jgi:hypothetical protein
VVGLEHDREMLTGILFEAGEDLGVHPGDPRRCGEQSVAFRILPDGQEDLPDGALDPEFIDPPDRAGITVSVNVHGSVVSIVAGSFGNRGSRHDAAGSSPDLKALVMELPG